MSLWTDANIETSDITFYLWKYLKESVLKSSPFALEARYLFELFCSII